MEAFATLDDLKIRWKDITDYDERITASTLLLDASYYLAKLVKIDPDDDEQKYLLKVITCNMVRRTMSANTDSFGHQSESMTAGPYSQSVTYYNPSGDMYLTKNERRLLGIGALKIGTISPFIDKKKEKNV